MIRIEREYSCIECGKNIKRKTNIKDIDKAKYCSKHCVGKILKFPKKKNCKHCNRDIDPGNYSQYHGDKCKYYKDKK